jgi:protein TonB
MSFTPIDDGDPADENGHFAAFDARWPGLRRRLGSMAIAVSLEALVLLLLLTLGDGITGKDKHNVAMTSVSFAPEPTPSDIPDQPEAAAKKSALPPQPRPPQPRPESPSPVPPLPIPLPSPAAVIPLKPTAPPAAPAAPVKIGVRMRDDPSGPSGPAGVSMSGDSQVVGSGPHGEPLYAARWYREPTDQELRGYLSTVNGPGWAMINCQTAPQWRVENCYLLDQNPDPGMLGKAVLAAAWQFQVRPPQVGGKSLVGSWVRIRIDYQLRRSRAPDS